MTREMPTMTASAYATSTYDPARVLREGLHAGNNMQLAQLGQQYTNRFGVGTAAIRPEEELIFEPANRTLARQARTSTITAVQPEKPMTSRRLVQVFIADPDENLPLASSMLHRGEQKLTDATDQELFFEVDIKTMLDAHNTERVKYVNRKVKERTEYLEAAKIRDLKMVVVTIATF